MCVSPHVINIIRCVCLSINVLCQSYRHLPTNMEVITWLGVWYVKSELYEPAIQYFERAAEIEPHEVKWQLMVASCYRRMGNYAQALDMYKEVHKRDPENIECTLVFIGPSSPLHYFSLVVFLLLICSHLFFFSTGLRYLCTLAKDLNDKGYEEYSKKLRKAERLLESKESQFHRDDIPLSSQQPQAQSSPQYGAQSGGDYNGTFFVVDCWSRSLPIFTFKLFRFRFRTDSDRSSIASSSGGVGSLLQQANAMGLGGGTSLSSNSSATTIASSIAPRSFSRLQPRDEDVDDEESVGDLLPL